MSRARCRGWGARGDAVPLCGAALDSTWERAAIPQTSLLKGTGVSLDMESHFLNLLLVTYAHTEGAWMGGDLVPVLGFELVFWQVALSLNSDSNHSGHT